MAQDVPVVPVIPVLVVGGGIGGSMLTAEFRRRGVACRTIDKLPASQSYSKALTIHARTLEAMERLDQGVLTKFLDRGVPIHGFRFDFKGVEECPALDFRVLETSYPMVLLHRQNETEQWIRDYIKEGFDYEIEWNTELVEVSQDASGVTAKLIHKDDGDREETVRARYLIAADGIHSRTRTALGLDYEGTDYTELVLQNMDVPLENYPEELNDWLTYFMTKDRFIMIGELPGGVYRLLLSDSGASRAPGTDAKETFQAFVSEHLPGVKLGEPLWTSVWETWVRHAGDYRKDNVFLVGDSAHVHSPSGGQGMNCCLQDAANLAWKMSLVLQGKARPALLDSYEAERRPIADQVIGGASAIHEIIMKHGVNVDDRLEQAEAPGWLETAVGKLSGVAFTYRDAVEQPSGLAALEGPTNGDRAPDVQFSDGRTLFSMFRHPDLTLLLMPSPGDQAERDECHAIAAQIRQAHGDLIRTELLDAPGAADAFASRYGKCDRSRLYLVRPDGYIGHRCLLSERASLERYLSGFLL